MSDVPGIQFGEGAYTLQWDTPPVKVVASRISMARGGITARLVVSTTLPTYERGGILISSRVNILSATAKRDLIKDLVARCKEVTWTGIVEQLCAMLEDTITEGEPPAEIETTGIIEPVNYLLWPLLLEGQPVVLYGNKGVAKSTLALLVALLCKEGLLENPIGWGGMNEGHPALYCDWEADQPTFTRRLRCLAAGMEMPPCTIAYRRFVSPLAEQVGALQSAVTKTKAELIIIDSLGPAAGQELNQSDAPIAFYQALRSVTCVDGSPPSVLIIAHNSKGEGEHKTIYGNVFFGLLARSIWEVRKDTVPGGDGIVVGLFHRASNDSALCDPIGLNLRFVANSTIVEPCKLGQTSIEDVALVPQRILEALRRGPLDLAGIVEASGVKQNTVSTYLTRFRQNGKVMSLPGHLWGLATRLDAVGADRVSGYTGV